MQVDTLVNFDGIDDIFLLQPHTFPSRGVNIRALWISAMWSAAQVCAARLGLCAVKCLLMVVMCHQKVGFLLAPVGTALVISQPFRSRSFHSLDFHKSMHHSQLIHNSKLAQL